MIKTHMNDLSNVPFHNDMMKLRVMSLNQLLDTFPVEFTVENFVDENNDLITISTKEYLIKLIEERFSERK